MKSSFFLSLKLNKIKTGYTLIELLVVLGVLTITVGALTMFLTSVFRGTNKANAAAEVKQNGQVILDSLERHIRGAVDVVDKDPLDDKYIMLTRSFGDPLHIKCQDATATYKSRIAVAEDSDPGTTFSDIAPEWRSISNDDLDNGVSINPCAIFVASASVSTSGLPVPAVVSIGFTAQKDSDRAEFTGRADFRTTISLRQY